MIPVQQLKSSFFVENPSRMSGASHRTNLAIRKTLTSLSREGARRKVMRAVSIQVRNHSSKWSL